MVDSSQWVNTEKKFLNKWKIYPESSLHRAINKFKKKNHIVTHERKKAIAKTKKKCAIEIGITTKELILFPHKQTFF